MTILLIHLYYLKSMNYLISMLNYINTLTKNNVALQTPTEEWSLPIPTGSKAQLNPNRCNSPLFSLLNKRKHLVSLNQTFFYSVSPVPIFFRLMVFLLPQNALEDWIRLLWNHSLPLWWDKRPLFPASIFRSRPLQWSCWTRMIRLIFETGCTNNSSILN